MKKVWHIIRKVLAVTAVLCAVGLFLYSLIGAVHRQERLVCSAIQVSIDYESGVSFLHADEITTSLNYLAGGVAIGKPLSTFDLAAIERGLNKNPYIAHSRVYFDHAQTLHADIIQQQPILRIINNDGVSYYLSDKGNRIPLCDRFTARLPLVIGAVQTHEDTYGDSIVLSQLYALGQYMQHDSLANALIAYTEVLPNGDLILYPTMGGHSILFGRADATLREKMDRLKTFYHEAMTRIGWDTYHHIDLRYEGQVVCQHGDTTATATITETDNK